MDFWEAIRSALTSLEEDRLPGALTMIGIIGIPIGIGAVICTVAIGQGGQNQAEQQLQNLGGKPIWIEASGRNGNGGGTGAYGSQWRSFTAPAVFSSATDSRA